MFARALGRLTWFSLLLSVLLWLPITSITAQDFVGLAAAPRWNSPALDLPTLLQQDQQALADPHRPLRVGYPFSTDLTPTNSGSWTETEQSRVWRLALRTAGAYWISLGLDRYKLPAGASLLVRDGSGAVAFGPYTEQHVRDHGQLWLPPIEGDTALLELDWPRDLDGQAPDLHLGTVSHGYKQLAIFDRSPAVSQAVQGGAGPCNIDVQCPTGDEWQAEKRGVVKLLITRPGGVGLCSGSLINTTAQDCRPYVLTAHHCYVDGGDAASTQFLFNFERPACAGGSRTGQFISGSTQIATRMESDFRLLEMSFQPPPGFDAYFNGWSRATAAPITARAIHHPGGDFKKISVDNGPVINGIERVDHWRVEDWDQGTTEPGSSGCPLFDQNRRIVGQLDFGTAGCVDASTSVGWDEFGKLAASWEAGSTPTSRLRPWLDPNATGAMAVDGLEQSACDFGTRAVYQSHQLNIDVGNGDSILHSGESATIQVRLQNEGNQLATGLSGTLSTTDPQVTLIEDQATWPNLPALGEANSIAPHFSFALDENFPCGEDVTFALSVDNGDGPWQSQIVLETGSTISVQESFRDDMESGPNGWFNENLILTGFPSPWTQTSAQSHSPSTSWFVLNLASAKDSTLNMPVISGVPPSAVLRFWHLMISDNGFDGGVLETSLDGTNWTDAGEWIFEGGYNGGISDGSSNIAGRQAWTGNLNGWQSVAVDLSSFAGQNLFVRWRFTSDNFIGSTGWYVDDVVVEFDERVCPDSIANLLPGFHCNPAAGTRAGRPGACGQSRSGLRVRPPSSR